MSQFPPVIRVGLIGYGFAGKTFHKPLLMAEPRMRITRVASSDSEKVHADLPDVAVDVDPAILMANEDVDLVVIATPNEFHAPLARQGLLAGKNVVVDKPFTLTLPQARELITLATQQEKLLSVFHNRRWDSDFLSVKNAIAGGLIGRVTHYESHIDRFRPVVRERWREGNKPGAGLWFDLGPHLVDQALCLFGLPRAVHADLMMQREGALSDDWAHVVLEYDRHRVILHASMLVAGGVPRFVVHGERGSIIKRRQDEQEAQLLADMLPGETGWGHDPDPLYAYDENGSEQEIPALTGDQRRYYAGIADALTGIGPNPVPPIQALAVMAVIEAANRSAFEKKSVGLDLTKEEMIAWL
ncbi:oxidoreductase [Gluconobacter kanchanaburiensis]|uniref:Oxidoreductase n=1 Tax=Gluconobacter kanchanaburiensis NBRC 103587 TaxID=1307948 RepID=A0A511B411_9PROT|nr:oxidoreductase [Gluconobacter kanchanaburiensis]MBF0861532.1 oxidoreductase [Gluconobacter kanchanaburiensis]GBR66921.1 oxidoreductase [Gluconobacter kanchanaburiensis NBRC 103587]GEK95169.1 oxidoreductase [Gluconobacter kanchanaburiensis NBRC 103587]